MMGRARATLITLAMVRATVRVRTTRRPRLGCRCCRDFLRLGASQQRTQKTLEQSRFFGNDRCRRCGMGNFANRRLFSLG
jgi:hypothetical protein